MEDFLFKDMWFYGPLIVFGGHDVEKVKDDFLEQKQMITLVTITDSNHKLFIECEKTKPPHIDKQVDGVILCCSYRKSFEA